MRIGKISILGGRDKTGALEPVSRVDLRMGDVVSIVGPTGSGKTALINDIGLFADANTPSHRRVLINDAPPPQELLDDPAHNPIALITQHTTFLSDLPVSTFLDIHARVRKSPRFDSAIGETLAFANQLTGEAINVDSAMTELSGGQTRALLIADAVVIGNSPIILLDEIENAGIHRTRALQLLREYEKIFVFVTHDPQITLLSDFRVVMHGGAMRNVIVTDTEEKRLAERIRVLDSVLSDLRDRIRAGERLDGRDAERRLREAANGLV